MKVLISQRAARTAGGSSLNADDLGNSAARFPTPARFRVEAAVGQLQAQLQQAEASLQASQKQAVDAEALTAKWAERLAALQKVVRRHPPGVDRIVRKLPGKPPRTVVTDVKAQRQRLEQMAQTVKQNQAACQALRSAIAAQAAPIEQLRAGIAGFETLAQASTGLDDVFVLAVMCRGLPKCPDPDERLFAKRSPA